MRRGLLLSFLLHTLLVLFFVFNIPHFILPEPEVTFMNVKLVTSPDAARSPKPKKPKAVKTQQSAAPKEAPKPKKKKVEAPKRDTKLVDSNQSSLKQKVKKEEPKPKQQEESVQDEPISRPPMLDKTPDKKNVMAEQGKPQDELKEEDFLQALDFIEDLESKKSALEVADEETAPTVFDESQKDVAAMKRLIEKNWYRTPGVAGLDRLQVVVMIRVNRDGTISSMEVVESSGRKSFDNSILRAVRKSVPLPIPEGKYEIFRTIQISFNR